MSKPVKNLIAAALKARYTGIDSACVVDIAGLDVQSTEQLRASLRDKSGKMHVVRNSLARRAFEGGLLESLGAALEGPCALVTSTDSIIGVAKTLVEAAKEFPSLTLKQAILDGAAQLFTVEEVSKMRSRNELLAEVAWLIVSPARAVAGCLQSPQSRIAGCLKAIAEKAA